MPICCDAGREILEFAVVVPPPRAVRFDAGVLSRLDRYVREHPGSTTSSAANLLIDEALRMHDHPGIVFRPGPSGRRAALAGGPEVWEVIAALEAARDRDPDIDSASLLRHLAEMTGAAPAEVGVASRYYAAYPAEIDERIALGG